MRITFIRDKPKPRLRILLPHTCPASVHIGWRRPHGVVYQKRHNLTPIANDRRIAPRTVKSNARLNAGINLSYRQAHRTIHAVLSDLDGDEKLQFELIAPMLEYLKQSGDALEQGRITQHACKAGMEAGIYNGAYI